MPMLSNNGVNIHYETHGSGPPLLLVPGLGGVATFWQRHVPAFARDFTVVLHDHRGCGRSGPSDVAYSVGQMADDVLQLMDALGIRRAALAGYDWGGRAACIVSALWPERVRCLVSCTGYNLQNIAASVEPAPAAAEHRLWYQYYFNTERGRAGLAKNRRDICRLLWSLWSPEWKFDDATFERSAPSFDNPDFVDVVIQSYRHRYGYAKGDPMLEPVEAQLARQPVISVPTINLHGAADGVGPASDRDGQSDKFTGGYERRMLPRIGHNVPQEAPAETVAALRHLMKETPQ